MGTTNYLVPDRECGECSVCCVSLRIDEPELKKAADVRCKNLSDVGCAIYTDRPSVCRNWYCGWRMIPSLGPEWRPDKAKLLLKISGNDVVFQPLKSEYSKRLLSEDALNLTANLIIAGFNVATSIPTKPGYCNSLMTLNDKLADSIAENNAMKAKETIKTVIFRSKNSNTEPDPPFE